MNLFQSLAIDNIIKVFFVAVFFSMLFLSLLKDKDLQAIKLFKISTKIL